MKRNLVVTVGKVLMGILMVCGAAYIYNFIGVTFFPSKPASAITATTSNVAVGNTGPVTQTLDVHPVTFPIPVVQAQLESEETLGAISHAQVIVWVATVTGDTTPYHPVSKDPSVNCTFLPNLNSSVMMSAGGPFNGRAAYAYTADCYSTTPIKNTDALFTYATK